MAPRKPVSAPQSGGGLKDLLSPRSPLEAAQTPVILKGAPGGGTEIASIHARGREDFADLPENENRKLQAAGRETLKGPYNLESKASNKEHGSHEAGLAGKEILPESKEDEEAEGDRNKKVKSAQLKELGNAHFANKDFQLAAEYYTQALEFDKENAVLYANRAQSRLNQGRCVSALDNANRAVTLNPSWWKAHAKRAQACLTLGHFRSAVGSFEEALKLQPNEVGLRKGLSEAKSGLRKWEAKSSARAISYPGWEETRTGILSTIDVDKQVNISLPGPGGKTVSRKTGLNYLHQAVIGGDLPLVVELTRLGAGLNVKTSTAFPCTALFLAVTVKARADANPLNPIELAAKIPSLKGQPLSEALEAHWFSSGKGGASLSDIAEYLLSMGADTEAKSAETDPLFPGMTPLAAAAEQKDWATCELLLKYGADPRAVISGGRTIENLVSGDATDRMPETDARMEELMAGLSVVNLHRPGGGKPSYEEKVTRAQIDREQQERVLGFKNLVAKYENEPRPMVLCRCGSRVPVLDCHGRGLGGLDAGTVLRRFSPGAHCPCQAPGRTYLECCWKSEDWVLDDDTGAVLNVVRARA